MPLTFFHAQKASAVDPVKIMMVGASITHGHSGDYTWRYRLWQHLQADGVLFDFVGPKTDLRDDNITAGTHDYLDPDFDQDHDATWGRPVLYEKDTIAGEMQAAAPDILLVFIGTNDLLFYSTPAEAAASMGTFIDNARSVNAGIKIVLSYLTPRTVPSGDPWIANLAAYNSLLGSLAAQKTTSQSPVVISDPTPGFDPAVDTYDDTHPSPSGEYKIAAAFANALADNFQIGSQFGAIPTAPAWPQAPTGLIATPASGSANLSWNAVPGATGYYVRYRDVTAGQTTFTRWSSPVTTTSATSVWMTNGHTYEFAISTRRYNFDGPTSNVASVIPGTLAAPTGLTATPGGASASLSWNAVTGATGYYVHYRDVTAGQTTLTRWSNPVTTTSATSVWMTNGHTYEFAISTQNSHGTGPVSAAVSVIPGTLLAPTGLTATPGNASASLSWNAVTGATGYYVHYRDVTA
ncbi:fibronectin type III domain-containing protein, partial [Frankia sp. CN6]